MSNERKEECRHDVLHWLADRSSLSHSLNAIRRGVNRQGADYTDDDIKSAILFLADLEPALARARRDSLGSTAYYQATSAGVLAAEREET